MKRTNQRGGTLVEAALVLVVFLTFLFGIMEFGRGYNLYQVATNAAREGARFAVAPCSMSPTNPPCPYGAGTLPTSTDITSKVTNYLASANVRSATVNVDQQFAGTVNGIPLQFTQVRVNVPYTFLFFKSFGSINIKTQAVMRNETNN